MCCELRVSLKSYAESSEALIIEVFCEELQHPARFLDLSTYLSLHQHTYRGGGPPGAGASSEELRVRR